MSAIFRAELANLQRLVARAERERQAETDERERVRSSVKDRVKKLHAVNGRLARSNRATVLDCVKRFGSQQLPISANKVAEITGLKDDTTRKHMRELAESGDVTPVVSLTGKQTRYYHQKP